MQIHRNIWLGPPAAGLHWKDAAWLAFGVSLDARALSELAPGGVLISAVPAKLGVRNRVEAAIAAHEAGPLAPPGRD
ncbi:hypothetical protein [Streptomyces sp. CS149]|uniref:hypothetical protein n=1 Tax=Streptomyces sp. CS149 TaxID=2109332 RepID=UPI001F44E646|nr:hypothetical protein [Streptomyces sp. CS149]